MASEIKNASDGAKTENGAGESAGKTSLKFLFVSFEALSGDAAWRIRQEGHEVKYWIQSRDDQDVGDGFLEKVERWEDHKDWADIVVFDDTGFGKAADALRKAGKAVVGGSEYTDRIEEDREFGQEEMKRVGMAVLPHWDFADYEGAITFIRENPARYVFKPSGSIPAEQKGILFIGQEESGNDLVEVLEHNKKTWSRKIKKFQLQKYAQGVEIAVGAFFNGHDFVYPININFEHKKLFPGEIGPYTGEMGTLMYWNESNKIFRLTLEKIKPALEECGYAGYIDINCIANNNGVYPLEFTARFGYPTLSIQMEGILNPIGEWFSKLARGESFALRTKKGFQIGVVVAIPPFPYQDKAQAEIYRDSSIVFRKANVEGVHLGDVKLADGDWRVAGDSGYALVVTGSGTTVGEARKMAYNRIGNIILQNKFYRTDIGLRWNTDSDRLQSWGYLY
ncbi:MAG: phosphoribosylamine--glycine ligase [Candidatus Sungbacteria bacterium]|uniref:phosphoribosylamine--glycine ligase n=1 Tax=Candidatus Sungiibacteriota bacterium TaxID=2750080 RepID=A0A932VPJ2_9BACT|nr:phosphoribosylamine--glycine ligase [Candidatus Sungbacteria bacterium]